jgi:hypothetical protein
LSTKQTEEELPLHKWTSWNQLTEEDQIKPRGMTPPKGSGINSWTKPFDLSQQGKSQLRDLETPSNLQELSNIKILTILKL